MPGARIIRGDKILPVDIKSVLKEGRLEQNIWLKGGDTIFIPSSEELKCYVVGAVQSAGAFPAVKVSRRSRVHWPPPAGR
jgi:polysaccharide biosynthesis/export protein